MFFPFSQFAGKEIGQIFNAKEGFNLRVFSPFLK